MATCYVGVAGSAPKRWREKSMPTGQPWDDLSWQNAPIGVEAGSRARDLGEAVPVRAIHEFLSVSFV
jgi:hypothetical protein